MSEALFYHLEHFPLERVLPNLIEKSLERNWRVIVRSGSQERLDALDLHLWTYRDDSFLPHGTAADGAADRQPVWLGCDDGIPNAANTLFLIDGAEAGPDELAAMEVAAILFDGLDEAALAKARAQWCAVTEAGLKAVYWAQDPQGGWAKRHEAG